MGSNTVNEELLKAEARKKIYEHARDYLSCKITIPLGSPELKKVHTNQFLFTHLPAKFDLANWTLLGEALASSYTRYGGDKVNLNRWYIEGVTIDVDKSGNAKMDLDLNAFPSSVSKYTDAVKGFREAYSNAANNASTSTDTSSTQDTTNATNTNNSTIQNGWWGKWVTSFVKETVGNETDTLKKCQKMYYTFRSHVYYSRYNDMPKTGGSVSKLENVWKNDYHINCGDGANMLSAFYSCCGATSGIYLSYDREHYVVKCTIDGKDYWTDQSGAEGKHNTLRGWDQTYGGYRSGNYKGKYV